MITAKHISVLVLTVFIAGLSLWLPASTEYSQKDLNEEIVIAGNWQHHAPEYNALVYQTFNMAHQHLSKALKKAPKNKKLAIITDIDDTLLDGTLYFTSLQGTDQIRSVERSTWWWNNQHTFALPGAVNFLNEVHNKNIEIFYISGRFNVVKEATFNTLKKCGFPVADKQHILLQESNKTTLSKEEKRQAVRDKGYHVLMIFGDQLDDLAEVDGQSYKQRREWVANHKQAFGTRWYFLPNVVYGSWEEAISPNYSRMTPGEKHNSRLAVLSDSHFQATDPDFSQHLTLTRVWMHTSADYTALCYQAYNHAGQLIRNKPAKTYKNPVIITSIDGTVLDFIPDHINFSDLPENSETPSKSDRFINELRQAHPIPGSVDFLNLAKQKGDEVFYVSSRPLVSEPATVAKLASFNFPFADQQHVLLKQEFCRPKYPNQCGKEFKRAAIKNGIVDGKHHEIALQIGDVITDFSLVEQGLDPHLKASVASVQEKFGTDYIVLPNPLSSVWMWQLYNREAKTIGLNFADMNQKEQAQLRRSLLPAWEDSGRDI